MMHRQSGLLPDWLDMAARSAPERMALECGGARWTFADLRAAVDAAAAVLAMARGERGGRIGILAGNRPGFVFAVHAARWLGIPIVPLNWRLTEAELAWQLRDAGVGVLVVDDERLAVARAAAAGLDLDLVSLAALEEPAGAAPALASPPAIDLAAEAAVIYTSGTSGQPKGARLTYGNLWYSAIASALHLGHHRDDVWLAVMPLFHIGGLSILVRGAIGATPVVLHDRFDPERTLAALDAGATLVSAVPTMMRQLLECRRSDWPASLRCVLLGGSASPAGLVAECLRRGIPVAPTYGLTEAASQVTTLLPDDVGDHLGSSGRPLPLTEVRIARGNGLAGEIGEIAVRGPTVFAGYVSDLVSRGGQADLDVSPSSPFPAAQRAPGPTRRERGVGAWFGTGDVGYLDEDGYLYVVDRRDDLIVSGGENVYPAEIERVLLEHLAVRDAAVVGLADARWGARPVAFVVWQGDEGAAASELLRHCRQRLAAFKIPERILVRRELPRSPSGKLLRRRLRDALAGDEAERD